MNALAHRYLLFACSVVVGLCLGLPVAAQAAPLTNLDGECQQSEVDLNVCAEFPDTGVVIEAITGNNGEFPRIIDGRSWFSYKVTDDGRGAQPSHFNIELLICPADPDLVALFNSELSGPNAEIKDEDPSTGLNYQPNKLVKFDQGVPKNGMQQYDLVFNSDAIGVDLVGVAIKAGRTLDQAMILGPGCGKPDITVSKTCTAQQVKSDGIGETIESFFTTTITNTGNLDLFDAGLQEQNTNLSCEIVSVDGEAVTPVAISSTDTTTVPSAGSYNGLLAAADSNGENGGAVEVGLRCEAADPNLVNTILAKGATSTGFQVSDSDVSDMGDDCPLVLSPDLTLVKQCDSVQFGERLAEVNGMLVVEICPEIIVSNSGDERLDNVTVTDAKIAALAGGVNVGNLLPGDSVKLSEFLVAPDDLCYLPSSPNEDPVATDDAGEAGNKYDASTVTFTNTASASGTGLFSGNTASAMDSATCSLADCPASNPDAN